MDIIFLLLFCSAGFPYYRSPPGGPVKTGISYNLTLNLDIAGTQSELHHTSSRIHWRQKRRWAGGKRYPQDALQSMSPCLFPKVKTLCLMPRGRINSNGTTVQKLWCTPLCARPHICFSSLWIPMQSHCLVENGYQNHGSSPADYWKSGFFSGKKHLLKGNPHYKEY